MTNKLLLASIPEVRFIPGPRPIPVTALLQGNIAVFSEPGSGWAQGTSGRQWLVLAKRRNAVDDRFPVHPKGAKQMTQYRATAINKDQPLFAVCNPVLDHLLCSEHGNITFKEY